jgi:hypothetical protein
VVLVVLVLGADAEEVLSGDLREIVAAVFGSLRANPAALTAFVAAALIVLLGASGLTFIIKGGTVTVLADAESAAGPIERPPLRVEALRREPDGESDGSSTGRAAPAAVLAGACLPRRLCAHRHGVHRTGRRRTRSRAISGVLLGWHGTPRRVERARRLDHARELLLPADADGDRWTIRRCAAPSARVTFLARASARSRIFGIVLLLVVVATVIDPRDRRPRPHRVRAACRPAVVPLQVAAWLLRGFVFQYLALTALGAYLTHYRHYLRGLAAAPAGDTSPADFPGQRLA